jgi:glutamate/tyrosine decarboxylase-like PLP-dependent enzyme
MLAARAQAIKEMKKDDPDLEDGVCLSKLVAYCSKEAHSCVEKAAMISLVKLRILEADENCSLRGDTVEEVRLTDIIFKL